MHIVFIILVRMGASAADSTSKSTLQGVCVQLDAFAQFGLVLLLTECACLSVYMHNLMTTHPSATLQWTADGPRLVPAPNLVAAGFSPELVATLSL